MYIFKTSGNTYDSVIYNQKHAFKSKPNEWNVGEIVLVSKNKVDLRWNEKQINHIMRLENIKELISGESEKYWPGTEGRWKYLVECFDTIELKRSFNLNDIIGANANRYGPIVTFGRISNKDAMLIMEYIEKHKIMLQQPIESEIEQIKKELRSLNNEYTTAKSKRKSYYSKRIERIPRVIALLKRLHPYKCQLCDTKHFLQKNGDYYSEVHHIIELSKGGSQATDNCLVVCPTCHRKMHYADVSLDDGDANRLKIVINGNEFMVKKNIIGELLE